MNGKTMSEQMTSRDIEDVLVSIRRLVTEDLRPAAREEAGDSGKLLLTPAHRVIPEPAGARPVMATVPTAAASNEPRVDLVVAALGRAVKDRATEWESETGDPSPLRLETPVMPAARPAAPHHGGRIRFASAPAVDLPEDEPPLPEPTALAEADTFLDDDEAAEFHHLAGPAWAQIDPASEEVAVEPGPTAPRRDAAWSDAAEAAARAELEGAPRPEPMQEADYDDLDEGESVQLDEHALREIVRSVLREELAGPLGERITRNIRKLVHQEIARALAVRNLD